MTQSLHAILMEEKKEKTISRLCKAFGFAHSRFIVNGVIKNGADSREKLCLIVERDPDAKEGYLSLNCLQSMLIDALNIQVELIRKEGLKEIYQKSILDNSLLLSEDEEMFRSCFEKIGDMDFDDVIYKPLARSPEEQEEFKEDLALAKSFLEKRQKQYGSSTLFSNAKNENLEMKSNSSETISQAVVSLEKEVDSVVSSDSIPAIKEALLNLPEAILLNVLKDIQQSKKRYNQEGEPFSNKQRKLV